jgi:hypothetical protein
MKKLGTQCLEELSALGIEWKRARRKRRIATPITVPSMEFAGIKLEPIFRKPPFLMDCHLALSLARIAPALKAMGVSTLRFSSIHQWRRARLKGRRKRTLSRHALGLAVDVYEMIRTDGTKLVVQEEPSSILIASVTIGARTSALFRLVLSPFNDPESHYDHVHFEAKVEDPRPPAVIAREKQRHRRIAKRRRARKRRARQARRARVAERRSRKHRRRADAEE